MQSITQAIPINRKTKIKYLVTYGICFFALGLGMAAIGPMLPYLANHVSVSLGQISYLFTAGSLGYLFGAAGGGQLFDRFNGHRLMLIALLVMTLMCVVAPLASSFFILIAAIFILGLGQGLLDVGGNVNIFRVIKVKAGAYLNALHFAFGVGAFIAPILIHLTRELTGSQLNWPFWILAILFIPGFIGLLLLESPENPDPTDQVKHNDIPKNGLVALIMLLFLLYVGIEAGYGGWIFTYSIEKQLANQTTASILNSLFWGSFTLGRLITIPVARKVKPKTILIGNFTFAVLILVLILIWPDNKFIVWVVSAGFGLALSSIFPTLLVFAEGHMNMTGKITGLFFLGSSLGSTLLPMLLGQIFDRFGSYPMMGALFSMTGMGFAVLLIVLFVSKHRGKFISQ